MTPNEILKLSDKDFHKLVDNDLRRNSPNKDHRSDLSEETSLALRSPAVVDRWHSKLARMAHQVEMELETRVERNLAAVAELQGVILGHEMALLDATDPDEIVDLKRQVLSTRAEIERLQAEHHSAQARTLRFRTGLDQHLMEAKFLCDSVRDRLYDSVVAEERNRYAQQVQELKARVVVLEDAIEAHRQAMRSEDMESTGNDLVLWAVLDKEPAELGVGHLLVRKETAS